MTDPGKMDENQFRHYLLTKLEGHIADMHRRMDFLDRDIEALTEDVDMIIHRLGGYRADDFRSEED